MARFGGPVAKWIAGGLCREHALLDGDSADQQYRGLNNYLYYFGGPYYNCSIVGPKTLF